MSNRVHLRARGFSLIEVMIAVIVLSVGLLALAALQGELFRSGAEAKARANAATIAQQVIEDARTFGFVVPPDEDYTGNTYTSLESTDWTVSNVAGVEYNVEMDVVRYRFNSATDEFEINDADPVSVTIPEFKMVRVSVAWTDSNGLPKKVQMADSIAAISPSDVAKVMEGPSASEEGPQVWIQRPDLGNPRVVPIAVGGDESAASSNPSPEQFVHSNAAVTQFSVMTFTGDGDEVLLGRKLDMAVAACMCQDTEEVSDEDNPAYAPTVWNGIQLAYEEPEVVLGATVGTADVTNSESEIEPICTVCCRDHRVSDDRSPAPDPWRESVGGDSVATHYGYDSNDDIFDIELGLLPSSDTDGIYLEACQLTRVNGRMRMTVDAMQTALVTTALDDANEDLFEQTGFGTLFSDYVIDLLETGLGEGEMPAGYPGPDAKFPASTVGAHTAVTSPPTLDIAEDDTRRLVSFGVYVDYLSEETLEAYKCAKDNDNEDECAGLGNRNPLAVIPFYAINVASLGDWVSTAPLAASVVDATYDKGTLEDFGGLVTGENKGSADPINVTLSIGTSNTGLTGTTGIDLDDQADTNDHADAQVFNKTGVVVPPPTDPPDQLTLSVASLSSLADTGAVTVVSNQSPSTCNWGNGNKSALCYFEGPLNAMVVTIGNYAWKKSGNATVYEEKLVCAPSGATVTVISGAGTVAEKSTIAIPNMGNQSYTLQFAIINKTRKQGNQTITQTCADAGTLTFAQT